MDNSIYQIDSWVGSTFYYKNKILTNNNLYYYARQDYTSSSSITTDINNGNLVGYIYHLSENKPYFIWKPGFNYGNDNNPRVKTIQFGDGFSQRIPDGINNLLLNFNFSFDTRDLHEATAILHFLATRNGTESFCMIPPAPYGNLLRFICSKWTPTQNFYNNYTIQANFVQVPI